MRIVAGEFRGRRLLSPKSGRIRPTSDRVREAIFSIIAAHIPDAFVLDLFGGTGALGLEALSRGAARAVFVDQDEDAVSLIRSNVELCGSRERARIIHGPADRAIRQLANNGDTFHLIFLDPPYGKGLLEKALLLVNGVAQSDAVIIAEHPAREPSPPAGAGWLQNGIRMYGDTAVSFFVRGSSPGNDG
jgi:16S rRNA (guanine966-N2)-methyltransferase